MQAVRRAPPLWFILRFATVALSILVAVHFYFWLRLVHDTALPEPWFALATGALVLAAASIPVSLATRGRKTPFTFLSYVWIGTLGLLFLSLLLGDVFRLGFSLTPRAVDGSIAALVATAVVASLVHARRLVIKDVPLALPRLPRALDGFTIAQISDLHISSTIGRALVEDVVAKTNALKPDLIVITGDLADGDPRALREAATPLGQLSARHGVFFVTGNHEYFGDVDGWLALLRSLGVRTLRNERVTLEHAGATLDLAGIDDRAGRMRPGHGPDLDRALAGRDETRPLVLLAHRPDTIREAAPRGVDVVLSGHTHAGQIWPFRYVVKLDQPYVAGRYDLGPTKLYVSAGTGWWGPPMRLGTTREITKITLRAA